METGRRVRGTRLNPAMFCDSRYVGARKCCKSVTNAPKISWGRHTGPVGGRLECHRLDLPIRQHIRIVKGRKCDAQRR